MIAPVRICTLHTHTPHTHSTTLHNTPHAHSTRTLHTMPCLTPFLTPPFSSECDICVDLRCAWLPKRHSGRIDLLGVCELSPVLTPPPPPLAVTKLIEKGATLGLKETGGRNAWGIAHDHHNESTCELLAKHGLNFESHGGTAVSFPPAPKWRPSEKWN